MTDDPFELYRQMPSHQQRLASEKKINVYFIPGADKAGRASYVYAVCSALLHEQFVEAVHMGVIPDFAVVVHTGKDAPDDAVKAKMLEYYGFDHDAAESGA